MKKTIVGVDLAKKAIQVCTLINNKACSNIEMTPAQFIDWLSNKKPFIVIFEACSTSNFWKQKALELDHDAHFISAKLVSAVRQNQKTDKNDALAILQAAQLPEVTLIQGKTVEQQQLQSIMRLRELCVKQKTASNNQLKALLSEFDIRLSSRNGGLKNAIEALLEDAENGFSMEFREALKRACGQYLSVLQSVNIYDTCLEKSLKNHPDCKKLMKLEGGPSKCYQSLHCLGLW